MYACLVEEDMSHLLRAEVVSASILWRKSINLGTSCRSLPCKAYDTTIVMPVHCQRLCRISLCTFGNVPCASYAAGESHQSLIFACASRHSQTGFG